MANIIKIGGGGSGTDEIQVGGETADPTKIKVWYKLEDAGEIYNNLFRGFFLEVGTTSVTITSPKITTDSVLSFYTSIYGVSPTEVSVANGSVTLTFDAQESDMEVGVRIDG